MILVKTAKEVEAMKPACQISAEALRLGGEAVKPGVTTAQIDKIIYDYIVSQGARPNFKGLGGFPGSACISVNDVVIHGIPSHGIVLHEGDIVSIDTGAAVHGWNGDNAATFACGEDAGFSVVRDFVGHGTGKELHEDPEVPNFGTAGRGPRLVNGMVLAIEPMVNEKSHVVKTMSDGWTTKTVDGGLAAHFEHTIAITPNGPVILTQPRRV